MANDAIVTIRLPVRLKQQLKARAQRDHRSLSAQVLHDLETAAAASVIEGQPGRFLGLYAGTRVPTDDEIRQVRSRLWRRLGGARDRG